ncbi:hypothetical protein [Vibrio hepatarius]|uniref:hypothetical protein n=1 Tax=Vibrio hepatarius TaxID=171383 RepID=UPI001C09CEDA|nr:hypothetical protein [Vibrio hepatarius]MBU2897682.1 hypothetical protein [Vibrio hepatarius]
MKHFFSESKLVNVSQISIDGWWLKNTQEYVSKGTALGDEFTQNIYTPSLSGMIARYDRDTDTWSDEIQDMTLKPYWNDKGVKYAIGNPDDNYPEWAITQNPPKYDVETQTVLHTKDSGWKVYDDLIGKAYFDKLGNEFLVADYNFELPLDHTFEEPPKPTDSYGIKLVDSKWLVLVDFRGEMAYAKDRDNEDINDYQIEELGDIPDAHTLDKYGPYDSWSHINQCWEYDIDRHLPFKILEEKAWRDSELTKVLNRIDQYEKDQGYPEELRTSPIKSHDNFLRLLNDRKVLSDYPELETFPYGERPVLSNIAN